MDGHSTHRAAKMYDYMKQRKIIRFLMPASSVSEVLFDFLKC